MLRKYLKVKLISIVFRTKEVKNATSLTQSHEYTLNYLKKNAKDGLK